MTSVSKFIFEMSNICYCKNY